MFKDDNRDLAGNFKGSVAESVPLGSYMARVQIETGGWITKKVIVDRPDCLIILASNLFSVEYAPGKAPILSGQFFPLSDQNPKPAWVKICGLYLDGCEIAELGEDNHFSFINVNPGAYVIAVLSSSHGLMTEYIDVKDPDSRIVLDARKAGEERARIMGR